MEKDAKSDDGLLELMNSDTFTTVKELQNDRKQGRDLKIFNYKCIMSATNSCWALWSLVVFDPVDDPTQLE